jgi:hypothetical protein
MSGHIWPGSAVADMQEADFEEVFDLLQEPSAGEYGGASSRIASFLGFWRSSSMENLRVGVRQATDFVPASTANLDLVKTDDIVNLRLRQLYMPDLPHERCVVQVTWHTTHWFNDKKSAEIAHVTSCDAGKAGTGTAVGLPIFRNLAVERGLDLNVGIYAMADRGSQPIIELLQSHAISRGLKLAGVFNPAFGMTVPYIEAAVTGLTKLSKRNFKLANWTLGFGSETAPIPLFFGEYILLDGIIRIGRDTHALAWSDLKWDVSSECPTYQDGAFRNPYLILTVEPGT